MLETLNFVHGSAIRSLSLVMSECSLRGRGQGHVINFYIVDLEQLLVGVLTSTLLIFIRLRELPRLL